MIHFLQHFPSWRERIWQPITSSEYASAWLRHGGSVMTHPDVVEKLSQLAGLPVRYLGHQQEDETLGAIATWDRHIALSRHAVKRFKKKEYFDLGNAEIILPISPRLSLRVDFEMRYVSNLHQDKITNLKRQKESLALARPPEDYSKKFLYNQRRELRLFEAQGGTIHDILDYSPDQISQIYAELFFRRWGFSVPAKAHLTEVLDIMRPHMFGSVLKQDSRHIAIQLLYRAESPGWISVEYINGGVDPDFQALSPGSILSYLNTQAAWAHARSAGKTLRYSFGRADRDYKNRWCNSTPVFRT